MVLNGRVCGAVWCVTQPVYYKSLPNPVVIEVIIMLACFLHHKTWLVSTPERSCDSLNHCEGCQGTIQAVWDWEDVIPGLYVIAPLEHVYDFPSANSPVVGHTQPLSRPNAVE